MNESFFLNMYSMYICKLCYTITDPRLLFPLETSATTTNGESWAENAPQ